MVGAELKEAQRVLSIAERHFLDFPFAQKCFCRCCGFVEDETCSLEPETLSKTLYTDLPQYRVIQKPFKHVKQEAQNPRQSNKLTGLLFL